MKSSNYIDNQEFSAAVEAYVTELNEAKESDKPIPQVTEYIASCFLSIARGLGSKGNFVSYSYREEMIMDAVENCLKAVKNYKLDAPTRTGKPNAFAYFTQITYYAFLRRLAKEKKHQELRFKLIEKSGLDSFITDDSATATNHHISNGIVETLRVKMDSLRSADQYIDEYCRRQEEVEKEKQEA